MTATVTLTDLLRSFSACDDAVDWAETQPDLETAWRDCERGDWLLWIAARLAVDRKLIVIAACQCARMALHWLPAGEERPLIAIEAAEAWVRGEATNDEVGAAAAHAAYAADAYAYAAAAYATTTTTYARTKTLAKCAVLVRKRLKVQDIR